MPDTYSVRATILDSCVWIAFLHKEDSQHGKATKLMADMRTPVVVPEYVLLEVATVLKQKGYDAPAKRFVERVVNDFGMFLPAGDVVQHTATLFCSQKNHLSFVDTALVVLSETYDVVTFDTALSRVLTRK